MRGTRRLVVMALGAALFFGAVPSAHAWQNTRTEHGTFIVHRESSDPSTPSVSIVLYSGYKGGNSYNPTYKLGLISSYNTSSTVGVLEGTSGRDGEFPVVASEKYQLVYYNVQVSTNTFVICNQVGSLETTISGVKGQSGVVGGYLPIVPVQVATLEPLGDGIQQSALCNWNGTPLGSMSTTNVPVSGVVSSGGGTTDVWVHMADSSTGRTILGLLGIGVAGVVVTSVSKAKGSSWK